MTRHLTVGIMPLMNPTVALSVVCCTGRRDPRFKDMADSLVIASQKLNSVVGEKVPIEWIIVDMRLWYDDGRREQLADAVGGRLTTYHVEPKPSVWQGPYRLTTKDHWDKNSASNTGFIYANGHQVVFHDDCTLADEDWLVWHFQAMQRAIACCGTYVYFKVGAKVCEGRVIGEQSSDDHRLRDMPEGGPCDGGWLYGGNLSVPLGVAVRINGYDEVMSGTGGLEDCEFGVRCGRSVGTMYYPKCVNYQVMETHEEVTDFLSGAAMEARGESTPTETPARCKGFSYMDPQGVVHWMTKNHLPIWRLTAHTAKKSPDGFWRPVYSPELKAETTRVTTIGNAFNLRQLRALVRDGKTLPVPKLPTLDWRDGQPLKDM